MTLLDPDAGELLRASLGRLVGAGSQSFEVRAAPTFEEALAEHSNVELAEAGRQDDGTWRGSRGQAITRRSYMRNLQRYRNYLAGTGRESRNPPERVRVNLAELGRRIRIRTANPRTLAGVLSQIKRHGLTA